MMKWKRAILESPYAGDVEKNRVYALACARDMFQRGESSIASHLHFPRFLTRYDARERRLGIEAGHVWIPVSEVMIVYEDMGISSGMQLGIEAAREQKIPIIKRRLGWSPM